MAHVVRDPKGYYVMMGLTPQADLAAVKRAYRTRAKLLHPDRNPSPRASQEFAALTEAYRVLSDPDARWAYDTGQRPNRHREASRGASPSAAARAASAARSDAEWAGEPPLAPRTCRVCGRATADLRHRVLHRVRGRGLRVETTPIIGVFCRTHGDRTAVAASLYCWGLGWWGLPWGPLLTLRALWRNLWGGSQPAAENYQLLTAQARAFMARGNLPLARMLAEQARPFARSEPEKRHVSQLMDALADQPRPTGPAAQRRRGPGSAHLAQLAPLLLIAAVALYIAGPTRVITGALDWVAAIVEPPRPQPEPTSPPRPDQGPVTGITLGAPDASEGALPSPQGPFSGRTMVPNATPDQPAMGPTVATPRPPQQGDTTNLFTIRPGGAIVRTGPDDSYQPVDTLPAGSVVMVTETSRDETWSRILSARGISGFVPSATLMASETPADDTAPTAER